MTQKQLLDNKLNDIDVKTKKAIQKKKFSWSDFGITSLMIVSSVFGLGLFYISVPLAISALSLSGLLFSRKKLEKKLKENSIKRLEAEKKHITELPKKRLNGSDALNDKRIKKIKNLSSLREKEEQHMDNLRNYEIATTAGIIGTTLLSIAFPVATVASIGCLIGTLALHDKQKVSNLKTEDYTRRINNLNTDLQLLRVCKAQSNSSDPRKVNSGKNTSNVKNKKIVNSKNAQAVNNYVEKMAASKEHSASKTYHK